MPETDDFSGDAFRREALAYRQTKREALAAALVALETASWLRQWSAVKKARVRIEALTGITITAPLRRALEAARKAREEA